MQSILIIDDDPRIRRMLRIHLENQNFRVHEATTVQGGLACVVEHPTDLVLLDLRLGPERGQDFLQSLRQFSNIPVIILSVNESEANIVNLLDGGADDYVSKPFSMQVLTARIKAALRRSGEGTPSIFESEDLSIDPGAHTVRAKGKDVHLTPTEFELLVLFARHPGKVLTHHFILEKIWGLQYLNEPGYLRSYIFSLRKKIEPDPRSPLFIISEPGVGYRFNAPQL
ncbi:MAG: response regulator transcription factor [Spirochaetales bacterium]|nr:response regulator transcription factor [Spirochaetales bacterium]